MCRKKTQIHLFVKKFCLRFIDILWKFQPLKCDIFIPKIIKNTTTTTADRRCKKRRKYFAMGSNIENSNINSISASIPIWLTKVEWMARKTHTKQQHQPNQRRKKTKTNANEMLFSPFGHFTCTLLCCFCPFFSLLLCSFFSFIRSFVLS